MFQNAIYLSADPVERAEAQQAGYGTLCQHPREVTDLDPTGVLVIGLDSVLFGDSDAALALAATAAGVGVRVGIHTYHADNDRHPARKLAKVPNVVIEKTHRRVRAGLRRRG